MKIVLVPKVGFCFGVKRAFNIALEAAGKKPKPCQVLGPLVHNEAVIKRLKKKGIKFVKSLNKSKEGTIIISAHGEDPKVLQRIRRSNLKMIDATCPLVSKVQNLAKDLQEKENQVIIIGDKDHKEVKAIQAVTEGRGIIIGSEKDASRLKNKRTSFAAIVQTTQNPEKVRKIFKKLKKKLKNLKFYDTFCPTVISYQARVRELAPKVDLMLIIGSKTSANTKRLAEIVEISGKSVRHIENAGQLRKGWLSNIKKVGVATGTSAPDWAIKGVIKKLKNYNGNH